MTLSEEKEPKDDIVHGLVLERTCLHRNQRGDEVVNDEEHRRLKSAAEKRQSKITEIRKRLQEILALNTNLGEDNNNLTFRLVFLKFSFLSALSLCRFAFLYSCHTQETKI